MAARRATTPMPEPGTINDLFGGPATRPEGARVLEEEEPGIPRVTPTADRGVGAPKASLAREVKRAEAVRMGSDDPNDPHVRHRRATNPSARAEHRAEANSGQERMFEMVAGSRVRGARALDPFAAFDAEWSRHRGRLTSMNAVVDRDLVLWAKGKQIKIEGPTAERPTWLAAVDRGGYRFTADAPDCLSVLDVLNGRVKRGPDVGTMLTADTPPLFAPRVRPAMSEQESREKGALSYFLKRLHTVNAGIRDGTAPTPQLWAQDLAIGARIGLAPPPEATAQFGAGFDFSTLPTYTVVPGDARAYWKGAMTKLQHIVEDQWYGLGKGESVGEQLEDTTARLGAMEQRRTDRYREAPDPATPKTTTM